MNEKGRKSFVRLTWQHIAKKRSACLREEMVTLRFAEHYSGVVFDRFGKDIPLHRKADGQFTISVPIMVSNQFFGWLAGLGTGVRVESPARVSEEYRVFLQRILGQYEKTTE